LDSADIYVAEGMGMIFNRFARPVLRSMAGRSDRALAIYRKFCAPSGAEWAAVLRERRFFHAMGDNCSVQTNVIVTDPQYVSLGNNVRLSGCTLFGHDGSVNMINRAYGLNLDSVGKIDIRDNVFIGHQAIVLPGVTIGPNAVVAAGCVVTRDVPPNSLVGGMPAKVICPLDEHVRRLEQRNAEWPWRSLIEQRGAEFDPHMQGQLDVLRIQYFFGTGAS
jgi:acetyltransferase-like isoleucine patch superfamily enzyme